jgi:DNA-binding beta-propeller fold protein YncE
VAEARLYVSVADPESDGARILAFDLQGVQISCEWRLPVRVKALCVDGGKIFALSGDALYRLEGGTSTSMVVEAKDAEGLCVAADSVWMTLHNEGELIRWRRSHGKEVVARGLQYPRGVAVADDVVYVAESVMGSHGYVRRIYPGGGEAEIVAEGFSGPTSLLSSEDGKRLFVLESTSGTVAQILLEDGKTERICVGLEDPIGIVVIDSDLYVVEQVVPRRRFSSLSSNLGNAVTVLGRLVRLSNQPPKRRVLAEGFPHPMALFRSH